MKKLILAAIASTALYAAPALANGQPPELTGNYGPAVENAYNGSSHQMKSGGEPYGVDMSTTASIRKDGMNEGPAGNAGPGPVRQAACHRRVTRLSCEAAGLVGDCGSHLAFRGWGPARVSSKGACS